MHVLEEGISAEFEEVKLLYESYLQYHFRVSYKKQFLLMQQGNKQLFTQMTLRVKKLPY